MSATLCVKMYSEFSLKAAVFDSFLASLCPFGRWSGLSTRDSCFCSLLVFSSCRNSTTVMPRLWSFTDGISDPVSGVYLCLYFRLLVQSEMRELHKGGVCFHIVAYFLPDFSFLKISVSLSIRAKTIRARSTKFLCV